MSDDPLDRVLRLVAEGRLSAEEAAPILDALEAGRPATDEGGVSDQWSQPARSAPRYARIEVTESGRKAVNLRVPLSLGRRAISAIPGLSGSHLQDFEAAMASGLGGPIVDVSDEDGDGVRIVLE